MGMKASMFAVLLATILPLSAQQTARINRVENQLLAPCCYTEPVSRHGSEVAIEMRHEIEMMVLGGQSERQILDHYKALYGMAILVEPEGGYRAALYIFPGAAVVLGILLLVTFLQRSMNGGEAGLASTTSGQSRQEEYRVLVQAELLTEELEFGDRAQQQASNERPTRRRS
ncbi:MAG: cytochrome c-type biogenesis protein CcmH [Candidatus Acidiferrales bacterium]